MNSEASTGSKYSEMSFWEHLEELRWTILKSVIGIVVGAVISWIFIDFIINEILLRPARMNKLTLQNLKPFGQLLLYFEVAFIGGIILSIPNLIYQIWKFIEPALREKEKKYVGGVVIFTSVCFLSGVTFSYFVILPFTIQFAAGFGSKFIQNNIAVDEYLSIILSIILVSGVVFELPMVSFFLAKLGILKSEFMRKYRRHAILIIFIFSAVITPTTDPVSMGLLALPLVVLYEISIYICKFSQK